MLPLVEPYETNCDLGIRAIQIKRDWLINNNTKISLSLSLHHCLSPYIMASPVSCRNLKRRCLNSHMVRMVRVRSMMKMSRSALSCRWLSSACFSVTMFSMALSSSRSEEEEEEEEDARHTQMLTDRLTSSSSHRVRVALLAPLTVTLPNMSAALRSDAVD